MASACLLGSRTRPVQLVAQVGFHAGPFTGDDAVDAGVAQAAVGGGDAGLPVVPQFTIADSFHQIIVVAMRQGLEPGVQTDEGDGRGPHGRVSGCAGS